MWLKALKTLLLISTSEHKSRAIMSSAPLSAPFHFSLFLYLPIPIPIYYISSASCSSFSCRFSFLPFPSPNPARGCGRGSLSNSNLSRYYLLMRLCQLGWQVFWCSHDSAIWPSHTVTLVLHKSWPKTTLWKRFCVRGNCTLSAFDDFTDWCSIRLNALVVSGPKHYAIETSASQGLGWRACVEVEPVLFLVSVFLFSVCLSVWFVMLYTIFLHFVLLWCRSIFMCTYVCCTCVYVRCCWWFGKWTWHSFSKFQCCFVHNCATNCIQYDAVKHRYTLQYRLCVSVRSTSAYRHA